jgi:hypothetical protein
VAASNKININLLLKITKASHAADWLFIYAIAKFITLLVFGCITSKLGNQIKTFVHPCEFHSGIGNPQDCSVYGVKLLFGYIILQIGAFSRSVMEG